MHADLRARMTLSKTIVSMAELLLVQIPVRVSLAVGESVRIEIGPKTGTIVFMRPALLLAQKWRV